MNNVLYLNNDPILIELNNAIDKSATKRMLAFKYFDNNEDLLNNYLLENCPEEAKKEKNLYIKPISQLELPFN
tara:strand:+ start:3868 stop:4086 length:219 start_codon:yes stop_codon:yes gene_type:complete